MKKILGIILTLNIVLILVACGEDTTDLTPPTFQSVLIDGESPVSEGVLQTFYKQKEEIIIVQVNLINPSNVDITSIKINGINYRANRFTDNSNNSLIEFQMLAPNENGPHLFEVDEVIYQDGALMKGTNVEANNQYQIFVYKDIPTVTRVDYRLFKDSVSIDFSLIDPDQTIVEDSAYVRIYTNDSLIDEVLLSAGTQTVEFDNLYTDQQYEVQVIADYDLEDGEGVRESQVLYEDVYTTGSNRQPSAQIERIQLFENRIVFDVNLVDPDTTLLTDGLRVALYKDDTLISEDFYNGSVDDQVFADLFSNSNYSVKVFGTYDLRNGEGVVEEFLLAQHVFVTEIQYVPEPTIQNLNVEDNNITFNVDLNDPNNVFDLDTVQAHIYIDDVLMTSSDVIENNVRMQVYDLLSSFTFTLVLTSDYDLNDGEGITEDAEIYRQEYTTTGNAVPSITVNDPLVRQGYIDVDYNVSDPDNTITTSLTGVLYENGLEVKRIFFSKDNASFTFAYPVEYTKVYRVEILASYNLYDGSGTKQNISLYNTLLLALSPKAPTVEVNQIDVQSDEISIDLRVLDADNTVVDGSLKAVLLLDGIEIDELPLVQGDNNITFDDTVYSNTRYDIEIRSDIDLNEDTGIQTNVLIGTTEAKTNEKVVPTVTYDNMIETYNSIAYDLLITDEDEVIIEGTLRVELYSATTLIETVNIIDEADYALLFETLLSNKQYTFKVIADINLQDQEGLQEDYLVGEFTGRTVKKVSPTASIDDIDSTYTSIILDIQIFDETDSIVDDTIYAELYIDDVATGVIIDLSEGINSNVTFGGLESGKEYQVRIYATYDLNDGSAQKEKRLEFDYGVTMTKEVPTATITNINFDDVSITFDVELLDPTLSLIDNTMYARLYLDGTFVEELEIVKGSNEELLFDNLRSNTEYEILIEVEYNLNDGTSSVVESIQDDQVTTLAKEAPTASIDNIVTSYTSITFDVDLTDLSNTLVDNSMYAVLYLDGAVEDSISLNIGENNNLSFTTLYSFTNYEIMIEVDYDLNEVGTPIEEASISSATVLTEQKLEPYTVINEITTDDVSMDVTFNVLDTTSSITGNIKAQLLLDGVVVEEQVITADDTTVSFTGLLANTDYTFKIIADYNLNLENGVDVLAYALGSVSFTTDAIIEISELTVEKEKATFTVSTLDPYNRLDSTNYQVKLYDQNGDQVGQTITIKGDTTFDVVELLSGNDYTLTISATYDGITEVVHTEEFTTDELILPTVLITNYNVGEDRNNYEITFDINGVLDTDAVLESSIIVTLYVCSVEDDCETNPDHTQTQAVTLDADNSFTFTGTTPEDAWFVIVVSATINANDGNGNVTHDFASKTHIYNENAPRNIPTATISNVTQDETSITFDVELLDPTWALIDGTMYAVLSLNGDEITRIAITEGLTQDLVFDTLQSNTAYDIDIIVDYDLYEGNPVYTDMSIEDQQVTTDSKIVPTATITNVVITDTDITFDVNFIDSSTALTTGTMDAVLYRDGVVQGTIALSLGSNTINFDGLSANAEYTIKIIGDYNLNEDNPDVVDAELASTTFTTEKILLIDQFVIDEEEVSFDVSALDPYSRLESTVYELRLYDELGVQVGSTISIFGDSQVDLYNLYSDYLYDFTISATYDGVMNIVHEGQFTTDAKTMPSATISNIVTDETSITVDVNLVDPSNIVTNATEFAVLSLDGVEVESIAISTGASTVVFTTPLLSDTTYDIDIVVEYDLNDSSGLQTESIEQEQATTDANTVPTATISNIVVDETSISVDVNLLDPSNIVTNATEFAVLSLDGVVVESIAISTGANTVVFSTLLSDATYDIDIEVEYDLNDGSGVQTVSIEQTQATTDAMIIPTVEITNYSYTNDGLGNYTIEFDIDNVTDPDGILDGTIDVELYVCEPGADCETNPYFLHTDTVTLNVNNSYSFTGVEPVDGWFILVVSGTIDTNDGTGNQLYEFVNNTYIYTNQN